MTARPKVTAGVVLLTIALLCGAVAVVSYHLAILATIFAVLTGGLGLALLAEAADPRRKPNPRTTSPEHRAWLEEVERYG